MESLLTPKWICVAVACGAAILIACQGHQHSPNLDEVGHLPAGALCVAFGDFELYEVNPPLVKMLAALPVVFSAPTYDWSRYSNQPGVRREWEVGRDFISANGTDSFWYFTIARWALLPFWFVGTTVIALWARELGGSSAAVGATIAWCFCPEAMGWTATICPDSAAASMGVLAVFSFRMWLKDHRWDSAVFAGIVVGLALATKTTWLILIPVFLGLATSVNSTQWRHLALMAIVSVFVLNSTYGFRRSFTPLEDFHFFSGAMAGRHPDSAIREKKPSDSGNRFAGSWVGRVPIPLPASFVEGIDLQKHDFEKGKWSYLRGEHRFGGWWYWYIYALLVKTPVGLLLLFPVAVVVNCKVRRIPSRKDSACERRIKCDHTTGRECSFEREQSRLTRLTRRQEMLVLLAPALTVFVLVSSQTGFSRYLRYILPCYPFLIVWVSQVFSPLRNPVCWVRRICWVLLIGAVVSSLSVFPHSLSYFNELAGGPQNGPAHLIGASIDWGQDVLFLSDWCEIHPEAQPLYLSLNSFFDPRTAGIRSKDSPVDPRYADGRVRASIAVGPLPGWYAVSVEQLYSRSGRLAYLFDFKMSDMVGYSIYIYHITEEQADSWRQKHGLTPI